MPIANITVDTTKPKGAQLAGLVSLVYQARNLARQLKELMDQETDGTTYTTIETLFGLQSGNGSAVYNLVAGLTGASGALEVSAVTQFCARLG